MPISGIVASLNVALCAIIAKIFNRLHVKASYEKHQSAKILNASIQLTF